jgi:hypothetical protein
MHELEPRDRVILVSLIIAVVALIGTIVHAGIALWPRNENSVLICFQKVNEQVEYALALPAAYCNENDAILKLERVK